MNLEQRIATKIITALELEDDYDPETISPETMFFAPEEAGGLELDSLSALEIVAALSDEFEYDFEQVERDDLISFKTVADFIRREGIA